MKPFIAVPGVNLVDERKVFVISEWSEKDLNPQNLGRQINNENFIQQHTDGRFILESSS